MNQQTLAKSSPHPTTSKIINSSSFFEGKTFNRSIGGPIIHDMEPLRYAGKSREIFREYFGEEILTEKKRQKSLKKKPRAACLADDSSTRNHSPIHIKPYKTLYGYREKDRGFYMRSIDQSKRERKLIKNRDKILESQKIERNLMNEISNMSVVKQRRVVEDIKVPSLKPKKPRPNDDFQEENKNEKKEDLVFSKVSKDKDIVGNNQKQDSKMGLEKVFNMRQGTDADTINELENEKNYFCGNVGYDDVHVEKCKLI